jgi:hypothetical protein
MSDRYIIYNGSKSGHCCFEATVMDTTKPEIIGGEHYEDKGGKHYETVCECFEMDNAIKIAKALNAIDALYPYS